MKYTIFVNKNTAENTKIKNFLINNLTQKNWIIDDENPDYFFIIAGDGSLIKNLHIHFQKNNNIIFIPIKDSDVGYYYEYEKKDVENILKNVFNKKLNINKIPLLELINLNNKKTYYILNEVKILNYIFPIKMSVFLNDKFLENIHGTGLVVSSNNGSSGFINSMNGSIVLSKNNLLQFKEIAPVMNSNNSRFASSLITDSPNYFHIKLLTNNFNIVIDNWEVQDHDTNDLEYIIRYSKKYLLLASNILNLNYKIEKLKKIFINKD